MVFTSYDFITFIVLVFAAYWLLPWRTAQNVLLLGASYVFYGWVHPAWCALIAISTVVDYLCALGMRRTPAWRGRLLVISLVCNLGMLGFFKYFNFFADNVVAALHALGVAADPVALQIVLPAGISFYTFQTLSYTIDVWRGQMEPRRNFIDFALFVSFFPQLVAGPVERAKRFLPQIEAPRRFNWHVFASAWPLLVSGFLKKLVIADNIASYANRVYLLDEPSWWLLLAGTLAFTLQILADFSAYTDIARGSARLLGFDLMRNFNSPYLAVSPSDFWRRWHISFSSWIRDYLYIPLGGSRVTSRWRYLLVLLGAMGLSGLWHGAAWHFVAWGVFHALLLFAYRSVGCAGHWSPTGRLRTVAAVVLMFGFTVIGWMIFRCPSLGWLLDTLRRGDIGLSGDSLIVGAVILLMVLVYALPMVVLLLLEHRWPHARWAHALFYGFALVAIVLLSPDTHANFIYFQF
ncbi:MAG: MBOAT family protein [Planctomycetota bacterium]